MKLKIFSTKREIKELKEDLEHFKDATISEIKRLDAELFKMKYPNGEVYFNNNIYFGGGYANFKFAYRNKINDCMICRTYNIGLEPEAHKSVIMEQYAYIGLKFKHSSTTSERYFIVDMSDGKSIECTNQEIMGTVEWVSVGTGDNL